MRSRVGPGARVLGVGFLGFWALMASCQPVRESETASNGVIPRDALPSEMVWAWRRAETLTFLDVERTGVAAWMATVHLSGDELRVDGRKWPLRVPTDAYLAFVVRIESSRDDPPTERSRSALVPLLVELVRESGWPELQIDFDARRSERSFYRELLLDLREALPTTRLSMTGLLSWCWDGGFLAGLAVDEVVPMLYRLGPEGALYRQRLEAGGLEDAPDCHGAVGVSSDEPIPRFRHMGRRYLFHHQPWDSARYREQAERALGALHGP